MFQPYSRLLTKTINMGFLSPKTRPFNSPHTVDTHKPVTQIPIHTTVHWSPGKQETSLPLLPYLSSFCENLVLSSASDLLKKALTHIAAMRCQCQQHWYARLHEGFQSGADAPPTAPPANKTCTHRRRQRCLPAVLLDSKQAHRWWCR